MVLTGWLIGPVPFAVSREMKDRIKSNHNAYKKVLMNHELSTPIIRIALVDDHTLFVHSLTVLINQFPNCQVIIQAYSGRDILQQLRFAPTLPDIILLDIEMPFMNGPAVALEIKRPYPDIKIVALTMIDYTFAVLQMMEAGCCAYMIKNTCLQALQAAINDVHQYGYYNGDAHHQSYLLSDKNDEDANMPLQFTTLEKQFIENPLSYRYGTLWKSGKISSTFGTARK